MTRFLLIEFNLHETRNIPLIWNIAEVSCRKMWTLQNLHR